MRVLAVVSLLVVALSGCVDRVVGTYGWDMDTIMNNINLDNTGFCSVLQMDGFYGSQWKVPSFETCNWNRAASTLRFCTDNMGYQHQDSCQWQCSSNHTITLSMLTTAHTFNIAINGYVLTAQGWVQLPYPYRSVTKLQYGNWPIDKAWGSLPSPYTPLDIGINSQYYTGQSNRVSSAAPNNYPYPYPSLASYVSSSCGIGLGLAPIYRIPFPYWSCQPSSLTDTCSSSNTMKNYVSVNVNWTVSLNNKKYQICKQPNGQDFVFTRSCPGDKGNTSVIVPPPNTNGGGRGDPQFAGLRGQDYQVHGVDGGIYNIISDKYMQLNSKFVFLTGPRPCPTIPTTGRKAVACFAHSGSYLGNLALRTNADDRVFIESGPAERGISVVEVNGERLNMGDNVTLSFADGRTGYIHYLSTHEVTFVAGLFEIEIDNSDSFLNLRSALVRSNNWAELTEEKAHGLLGQTWQVRKGKSAIEGKVDDYMLMSDDLYGTDFMYNRFGEGVEAADE